MNLVTHSTSGRDHLRLVTKPRQPQFVHCPRCAFRGVARTLGRAIRALAAHALAVHGGMVKE